MSESSHEEEHSPDSPDSAPEPPENGLVSDEQLPEDLQPAKNPLARNPGEEPDESERGSDEVKVEGMPDMGEPGAGG